MATSHIFNGKRIKIPGAYTNIKSAIKNPAIDLGWGSLLVIDTGSGAGYGGGAGVAGTLKSNKDALYTFDNIDDFRTWVGGGLWWVLASPLFRPAQLGVPGISNITYIKAASTTPASIEMTFGDGSISSSLSTLDGGYLKIQPRAEGVAGNGALNSLGELSKGFAVKMRAGSINTEKFILDFFRGTFRGLDTQIGGSGQPFDLIKEVDSQPQLLISSPEVDNVQELIDWMTNDGDFKALFHLADSYVTGVGTIDSTDLLTFSDYVLATGGTETYNTTYLEQVLDNIGDINFDFILADKWGSNAQHADNVKILGYIAEEAKVKPDLYIGGGRDNSEFSSISLAGSRFYDSQYVTLVHGGCKIPYNSGFLEYDSIYKAAQILGREAGLAPQTPLAFKNINIGGELHILNEKEITQALDSGVLVTKPSSGSFDIVRGVNTLQNNDFLVNENGSTHDKSIRRISRQLVKELNFNIYNQLLKSEDGPNRSTLNVEDVEAFVKGYLSQKVEEGLIITFEEVTATINSDVLNVTFKFEPNGPIHFVFITGFIINL